MGAGRGTGDMTSCRPSPHQPCALSQGGLSPAPPRPGSPAYCRKRERAAALGEGQAGGPGLIHQGAQDEQQAENRGAALALPHSPRCARTWVWKQL